jgi:hypothetical protein
MSKSSVQLLIELLENLFIRDHVRVSLSSYESIFRSYDKPVHFKQRPHNDYSKINFNINIRFRS